MRLHSELADCLSRRERLEADLQLTYSTHIWSFMSNKLTIDFV